MFKDVKCELNTLTTGKYSCTFKRLNFNWNRQICPQLYATGPCCSVRPDAIMQRAVTRTILHVRCYLESLGHIELLYLSNTAMKHIDSLVWDCTISSSLAMDSTWRCGVISKQGSGKYVTKVQNDWKCDIWLTIRALHETCHLNTTVSTCTTILVLTLSQPTTTHLTIEYQWQFIC